MTSRSAADATPAVSIAADAANAACQALNDWYAAAQRQLPPRRRPRQFATRSRRNSRLRPRRSATHFAAQHPKHIVIANRTLDRGEKLAQRFNASTIRLAELPESLVENVGWLREQTTLPICIGFGISQPAHVKMLAPVADGLIVGSAVVRRIANAKDQPREAVIKDVGDYVAGLIAALE